MDQKLAVRRKRSALNLTCQSVHLLWFGKGDSLQCVVGSSDSFGHCDTDSSIPILANSVTYGCHQGLSGALMCPVGSETRGM